MRAQKRNVALGTQNVAADIYNKNIVTGRQIKTALQREKVSSVSTDRDATEALCVPACRRDSVNVLACGGIKCRRVVGRGSDG